MLKNIISLLFVLIFPLVAQAGDGFVRSLEGKVWVNGQAADMNTEIHFGDTVMTGGLSHVTILMDGSVYRIANSSKLKLPEGTKEISLTMLYGSLLAVFRHDVQKTIYTPTAVIGIRGTGLYLNELDDETYLCACYGDMDFFDPDHLQHQRDIHAEYHQVVVFDHESGQFSTDRKMVGHTDEDLHQLEELAGRTPPESFTERNRARNTVSNAFMN